MGSELRFLEVVVEMDHHRVDVLHILPFRHWVRGDGKLDASAAMRLAVNASAIVRAVKRSTDRILIPGVITQSTVLVEHPELVAERIERFAQVVGRENVVAGAD